MHEYHFVATAPLVSRAVELEGRLRGEGYIVERKSKNVTWTVWSEGTLEDRAWLVQDTVAYVGAICSDTMGRRKATLTVEKNGVSLGHFRCQGEW